MANERIIIYNFGEAITQLFSGFALILVDGIAFGAAFGIQGYDKKSVGSPTSENNVMGSQEAFAEVIRTNISLIRRRIKHPALRFEMSQVGKLSKTDVCLVYIQGKADEKAVSEIRRRLADIKLDSVLGTGFIRPFLDGGEDRLLFSEAGYTERPDMLCANIIQGRIGVLVDGTPFCIVCPQMFSMYFDTIDDYASKTYFASFLKIIRYLAFLLASAFPGIYLAAVNYNPEMLNLKLLANLSASEKTTVMPLFSELVVIMLLLEVMREASIRLPHAVGTAMSIAGGLIIGDSAVKSGIISSPLLILVGLTATASFVIPALSQQTAVLRIMFIFAGGFAGFFGISVCALMTLANICSQSLTGIPFTSPLSPFRRKQAITLLGRKTYKDMSKENTTIRDFK
jgi:spore germination protein KA